MVFSTFVILIMSVLGMAINDQTQASEETGALAAVLGIFLLLLFALNGISFLAMIVGQIMCMFAPKGNEKFNSIGSGLLVFLAMAGTVVGALVVGVALTSMSGPSRPSQGAAVGLGIGYLAVMVICGVMFLAASFMFVNFYRRVGQNIKSDALVKVSNQATIAMCVPFVMPFLGFGLGFILGISGAGQDTIASVLGGFQIFNALIFLVVSAVMLRMIWTGISSLSKS